MNVLSKREAKARDYRSMAQSANEMAAGAALGHVREKYVQAAAVWTDLAVLEEARIAQSLIPSTAPRMRTGVMSNDQKLAAIEEGRAGSYNLAAPKTTDAFVGLAFQHVAAQVLGIARGRGYFFREAGASGHIDGLLVTIEATAAQAPVQPAREQAPA